MALATSTGCFFELDRQGDFVPGEARGVAVVENAPVQFARTHLIGDPTFSVTGADGTFRHISSEAGTYVLRAFQDTDNDSWPERGALVSFSLVEQAHADGVFGQSEPRLSSVDLGNVTLRGTVSIAGVVVDETGAPARGAKVVVAREIRATTLSAEPVVVTAGVEAQVATDAAGAFRLAAVLPGEFFVVAIDSSGENLRASDPRLVQSVGLEDLRFDGADALRLNDVSESQREVIATLTPAPAAGVTASFEVVPAARGLVPISTDIDGETFRGGEASLGALGVGQYNVIVRTSDGRQSVPQRQLVLPGTTPLRWGTIELFEALCPPGDDCDGDGVRGLPINLLSACRQTCSQGAATCTVEDETYDCEDDGDGQIDSTEPNCYGVGAGTDCDSDGICDWEDEDPFCAPDDIACDPTAVENNCGLALPPDPTDGGVDGGVDAGPDGGPDGGVDGGNGPIDGGDPDAGDAPQDGGVDGGVDAGAPDSGVDAGPPPDFGLGVRLVSDASDWAFVQAATSVGGQAMVHLSPGFGGTVDTLAACPGAQQTVQSRHVFAAFDPHTGDCTAATYVLTANPQLDRVEEVTLMPHPNGAVAAVAFSGEVSLSNGFSVGPYSEGVAFILLRDNGAVELMAEHEVFGGNGSVVRSMKFAGKDDGTFVALLEPPSDGIVSFAGVEAANEGGGDLLLVSFNDAAQVVGFNQIENNNFDYFIDGFAATTGTTATIQVASFFSPLFEGTTYEMPANALGALVVDAATDGAVPQLVLVEGVDGFTIGRSESNALLIAGGVDLGAHLATIDRDGDVGIGGVLFEKSGPTVAEVGRVNGGTAGTYRLASLPDSDFVVVSYMTATGTGVIARASLDDLDNPVVLVAPTPQVQTMKLSAMTPSQVVYRTGGQLRTVPTAGGTPSAPRTVDPGSHLAVSPDGATTYFTAGRGGAGFSIDRVATADMGNATVNHETLFDVTSTLTPRLALSATGETLYILTETSFYSYDLVDEPVAPTLLWSHNLSGGLPADMAVFEGANTLALSSADGDSTGITLSPLDEWDPYGGFSEIRSVEARLPSGVRVRTPGTDVELGRDNVLAVIAFDQALTPTATMIGQGAGLTPTSVSESGGSVLVSGITNIERRDATLRVVVDGFDEQFPPVKDHPLRESTSQGFALGIEVGTTGEAEVQRFWTTNGLADGQTTVATEISNAGVVLLGRHFSQAAPEALEVVKLGRHSVDMGEGGSPWLWRPADDQSHPQAGLGPRVGRVSLDVTGAVHDVQIGAGPLRNERVVVVAATGGTLGAAQGCAQATADETALLVAVLDDGGRCVTSFAIVAQVGTADELQVAEPVVLHDGTLLLPISTPDALEFQSSTGTREALLPAPGAARVSAVIRVDALLATSATLVDAVTGDVGVGRLTLAPTRAQTMWTVPFSGDATLEGGPTFGAVDVNDQFAVFFANDAGPFDFYWESSVVTAGDPVAVESALILPGGDYALAVGPVEGAGAGLFFDHLIDDTHRATVHFHPSAPLSTPFDFRLDHFVGATSPLSLGYDQLSSNTTVTGTFSGALDVTDGENTIQAVGSGLNSLFMIALPPTDTTPSPPDRASDIAVVDPGVTEALVTLPHRNARSGAAMMVGTGGTAFSVDVGFRTPSAFAVPSATNPFAVLIGGTSDRLLLHSQVLTGSASVTPLRFGAASDQGGWVVGRVDSSGNIAPLDGVEPAQAVEAGDLWLWHVQRAAAP